MNIFGKLITAMVTPFDEEGKLDAKKGGELALKLCNEGSDSILVCGTTGESPTMTEDEQFELLREVKKSLGNKYQVMMGTGSNNTEHAIKKSRKAVEEGADGILLVAPYYNKPPQAGLFEHFSKIAQACEKTPIILYNIPGRTGINIENDTIKKLVTQHKNIVAVKDAVGNVDKTSSLALTMNVYDSDFTIYSGDDSLTLPMMCCGASGVISVASHIAGLEIKDMINSFLTGDIEKARRLHLKLLPLFKGLFETTNPILVKEALKLQGIDVGSPRLPLVKATKEQSDKLKNIIENLKKFT